MLPRREQQHEHQKRRETDRLPQLAMARLIDLADDRVVADVLLDRVFEWLRHRLSQPFGGAQLGAAGARVAAQFVVARHDRLLG
jgi:hypothetical protein